MSKTIQVVTADDNAAVYINGVLVSGNGSVVIPPPPPPPEPTIPPVIVNGEVKQVAWPPSGQVRPIVYHPDNKSVKLVTRVPLGLVYKPRNLGFCRFSEVPGASFQARQVAIFVNGVLRWDTGQNGDSAPSVNWTLGNPGGYQSVGGQFNLQMGDLLEVVTRAYNWAPGDDSSFLYDFATPLRY